MSTPSREQLTETLAQLPWWGMLPDEQRAHFVEEAHETLAAAEGTGDTASFATLVEEWRSTAEMWADPALKGLRERP